MTAFVYDAVDAAGHRRRGTADAVDAAALARTLEARGLMLLDVTAAAASSPLPLPRFGSRREVLEVTRAMASLLASGMPLARALSAAKNVASGPVAAALGGIGDRVERGESLADALTVHGELFSPSYVGLVRVGERSGELAASFSRLADQLERAEALRAKLLSSSIYPMLLAAFGGLSLILLVLLVIPRFGELVQGSGATLPPTTAVLIAVSDGVRMAWPLLFVIPIALVGAGFWTWRGERGRRALSRALLAAPGIAALRRHVLAAQFARTLGTLLSGGSPLVAALRDTVRSLSDPTAADDAERIRARVQEGSSLQAAVEEASLYPPLLAQLVAVGEESSRLSEFLLKAAQIFEDKSERAMQRLLTILEPTMIVAFGAIVALVALSLLQAIYGVNAGAFQ